MKVNRGDSMFDRKEYMKKYYQEHKEELMEANKKWHKNHPEWRRKHYQEHKEKLYEQHRKWQKNNSKRFSELCNKSRSKRVEKLKASGCINTWKVVNNGAEPIYKK